MAFFQKSFTTAIAPKEKSTINKEDYLNPTSLDPAGGTARMHVLSESPETGFELWFQTATGNPVPRRVPGNPDQALIAELEAEIGGSIVVRDGRPAIKQFAAFFIWDYDAERVRIFSATQKQILQPLARLTEDPDYAELSDWDIQLTRNGRDLDTKYAVDMKPTKRKGALDAKITAAWAEAQSNGADLSTLFIPGANPMGGRSAAE